MLLHMAVRLLCRDNVNQLISERAQAQGAAVTGNSCFHEAYLRAVDENTVHWLHVSFGQGLLVTQELYDAMPWQAL